MPDGDRKQELLEHLELIRSESMRCGNIVRDLLTYARRESADFRPTHLHVVIERALRLVSHHTELREIRTEADLDLEDDLVICDGEQIEQALVALLINAVEAMPDGGRVRVATTAVGAEAVTVAVSDTGIGIPEEIRDRIFDPFFSTKSETKGVGLGLAVVYGIAQRHEGDIRAVAGPKGGTTFTLELPRDPGATVHDRTYTHGAGVTTP